MRCGNVMALQIREIVFGVSQHSRCLHRARPLILGTLGCAQKSLRLVALCLVPLFVDYDSTNFLRIVSLCNVRLCITVFSFQPFASVCGAHCPMTGWFANGSPSGYRSMTSFKKAYAEEWVFQITDTSDFFLFGKSREYYS